MSTITQPAPVPVRCKACELPIRCRRCHKIIFAWSKHDRGLRTLKEAESDAIRAALAQFIEVELAAMYLGCSRSVLYAKMHRLGIETRSSQNQDRKCTCDAK